MTDPNQPFIDAFEAVANQDTSTTPTRNFDDAEERAAIAAAAKARRGRS